MYRLREEKRNFLKIRKKDFFFPSEVVKISHTGVPGDW